jgi:hypothetical protein
MGESVVVVSGGHDLAGVGSACEELVLFGCHLDSLDGVEKLAKLRSLRVLASTVSEISALRKCAALEDVEIVQCRVTDTAPLLDMPRLRRVKLLGNPLSQESFEKVPAALAARKRPVLVEMDDPDLWRLNLQLAEKGVPLTGADLLASGMQFARPGADEHGKILCLSEIQYVLKEALDSAKQSKLSVDELKALLPDASLEENGDWRQFESGYSVGDSRDAFEWLEASRLPKDYKADLAVFLSKFPAQRFIRFGRWWLDRVEAREKVKLPEWYRRTFEEVVGTLHPGYRAFEARIGDRWLRIEPVGYLNGDLRALFGDKAGLFPIAQTEEGDVGIGYRVAKPDEMMLYDCNEVVMTAQLKSKKRIELHPAGDSYARLLAHVDAVKIEGTEIPASG